MIAGQDYWHRCGWYARSRRRFLSAAVTSLGVLATAACAGGSNNKPSGTRTTAATPAVAAGANAAGSPAAKQPKRGGTFQHRVINRPYPGGLDPHIQTSSNASTMGTFYQGLLGLNDRTFKVEPAVAQQWESPSPTELVFKLSPGIKWHNKPPVNGRVLTADDVVFSLNRARGNDPKLLSRSLLASVDKIEAVDKSMVKITAKEPDATLLGNLAAFTLAIIAPEATDKFGDKFSTADTAIGTGAFVLQASDDTSATLARNPDYWKPGLPYLDGVVEHYIEDDQVAWSAFQSGQLDMAYVPGTQAKAVLAPQARNKFQAEWLNDVGWVAIQANTQKKPFDDPRVPQALRLLVDHQEAVSAWAENFFGRGRMSIALPAALESWDFSEQETAAKFVEFKQPKDDAVKQAMALLGAAGFSKDNPLQFTVTGLNVADWAQKEPELLQAQLRRLGQNVVQPGALRLFDNVTIQNVGLKGDFDYMITHFVPAQPFEIDGWFRTWLHSKGARNYGKWADPQFDQIVDRQRATLDTAARQAVVKDLLSYLATKSPYTSWSGRYQANAAQAKLRNWAPEGNTAQWSAHDEEYWFES